MPLHCNLLHVIIKAIYTVNMLHKMALVSLSTLKERLYKLSILVNRWTAVKQRTNVTVHKKDLQWDISKIDKQSPPKELLNQREA